MTPAAVDDPCWEQAGSFCEFVYTNTGENETLAGLADWFVAQPLKIIFVIVISLVATRLARRWIVRVVHRMMRPQVSATQRLARIGISVPAVLEPEESARREARASSISTMLTNAMIVLIWTTAVLTILGIAGIDLRPLIAGAGIAGVALGFGAQSLVKDCIAGVFMLLEDQYGIGDVVDLGEAVGVVEDISLRTTVLRGVDGTVWHVPNGVVQRVGNKSQLWSVAVVDVDVAYDSDLVRARELLHRAAQEVCDRPEFQARVHEPPTVLGVEALAADGITLRLTVRVDPGSQWEIQRAIREHVKQTFDDEGIEIPFPQRTIWMRVEPGAAEQPQ